MASQLNAYRLTSGGTPARMAILRRLASGNAHYRITPAGSGDWKSARRYTLNDYESAFALLSPGKQSDGSPIWYSHGGPEFRGERDAHTIVTSLPRGWYTDTEASETAIGIVARLSHGRFLTGYRWTSNGERVYFPEVYTDERDAAYTADGHAEAFAQSAREDSERFNAMQDAEGHVEAVENDVRMAIQARNVSPRHREHARDRIEELRAARRDLEATTEAYERG